MIRDRSRITGTQFPHTYNIHQIFCEFIRPLGYPLSAWKPFRVVLEQFEVVFSEHGCTGSRREDNGIMTFFKSLYGMDSQLPGLSSHPCVEGGLTAAGLFQREVHLDPNLSEYVKHTFSNRGAKCVGQAGDEELD
jgi:hypothetical protein